MFTFLLLLASQLADVVTTYAGMTLYPSYIVESNPLTSQLIAAGWLPTIAAKVGVAALVALVLRIVRPGRIVSYTFTLAYMLAGIVPAINNAYIIYVLTKVVNG